MRGIQFDEYATPAKTHGAVLDSSGGAVFENDWFVKNATDGLSVQGPGTLVSHDTMANNGQLGFHANQADGLHVTENEFQHNNTEGFDYHQEAGGMKVTSSNDVLIDDNLADANLAKGIWMDIAAQRATIVRNDAYSNTNEGIQFEISSGAVIAGNVAWRNGGGGIRIIESQHVDIFNNVLYQNNTAVDVWEGNRPQNVADVTIRNNVIMDGTASAVAMLDIRDTTNHLTAAQMGVSVDADAYCRSTASKPPQLAAWAKGAGQARYATLAAFTKATGSDAHGMSCDGAAAAKMLANAPAGNFALASGSPGAKAGVALPSNVAKVLEVSAGVAVDLGLLGPGVQQGPGPTITSQPESTSVLVGQTYTMTAAASGSPRPTVQWQVAPDGVTFTNINGATADRYSAVAAAGDNNKRFRAVFSNSGGVSISDPATLTVGTTAVVIADPGPRLWGQPLTLVANASMTGVAQANVGGTVTFYDGSAKLGARTVRAGVASVNTPRLPAGDHSFVAVYTVQHRTVSSVPTIVDISPANTMVGLTVSRKTLPVGGSITLSGKAIVLAPSAGPVNAGTISFYESGALLATVTVSTTGHSAFATSALAHGTHSLTAVYDGDGGNYEPSPASAPVTVTVK